MPPIKDSHNSDTVSNKQRSLSAIQAPVDPPQRHINPRAAEGILVSIKHPLAKHQVSGMLFWLEEAREEDCWFLFFSFFLPFFFFKGENVPGGTLLTVRVKNNNFIDHYCRTGWPLGRAIVLFINSIKTSYEQIFWLRCVSLRFLFSLVEIFCLVKVRGEWLECHLCPHTALLMQFVRDAVHVIKARLPPSTSPTSYLFVAVLSTVLRHWFITY